MPTQRLRVSLHKQPAMRVTRVAVRHEKLVYVIVANKQFHYRTGRSRIAYIGTTKRGVSRIAQSAADHTDDILGRHGVNELIVRIVACRPRRHVQTWKSLERRLLILFRENFGSLPICNSRGQQMQRGKDYFSEKRLKDILETLETFNS